MPSTRDFATATSSPFTPGALPWQTTGVAALVDPTRVGGNVHDRASRATLLDRIAVLLDQPLLSPMNAADAASTTALLVPGEALVEEEANAAGIFDRGDLLGGVVPAFFIGTKAISHGLVGAHAARPREWSTEMARLLGNAALPGYTAFSRADAAEAGRRLLRDGPVRIKDVCGKAGLGQQVVTDRASLDAAIAQEDEAELMRCGIVLEQNLSEVVTYSVGVVELGGATISYWGTQNLTRDHQGREVYGGSDLTVVRGGLKALRRLDLPEHLARAVQCAARFDAAAHAAYPGLILTRRNYDVIEGITPDGSRRTGVLEQSWRVGGASGAEIAAFEAFRAEPDTTQVCCSSVEIYDIVTLPSGAILYYQGVDPKVGALTKFAVRYA